jgi:uncharacterized protein
MSAVVKLEELLRTIEPVLNPGKYVFASVPDARFIDPSLIISSIREAEGLSVVMEQGAAKQEGLATLFTCAWITLTVHSDLQAVGLTAAFSAALGKAGISCNVVAGAYHDHIFVPEHQAGEAMAALYKLQQASQVVRE